ncbi:MAG: CDP-alcohol phosphatidyltransferase family protein [Clostridiales bacterium]|nr:CDP-alcohol phosphatidyltransferase family protein [Clostridiales bacterium]
MIVGKWNKSVILTYAGLLLAVLGIFLAFTAEKITYSFCCLMVAGICDLFDGMVARRCKRTEEEKMFGIELDSLVDVVSFIALPVCIFIALGFTSVWHLIIYLVYALFGVARLAYFNIATADSEKAVKYYIGLPVTYTALIFPLLYLLSAVFTDAVFVPVFTCGIVVVSVLEIVKIKVPKPKGIWYGIFGIMAIGMLVIYLAVL